MRAVVHPVSGLGSQELPILTPPVAVPSPPMCRRISKDMLPSRRGFASSKGMATQCSQTRGLCVSDDGALSMMMMGGWSDVYAEAADRFDRH